MKRNKNMEKKMESKVLMHLLNSIVVDKGEKDYIIFYLEMSWKKNAVGLDADYFKSQFKYIFSKEIENSDFSFIYCRKNKIVLVLSAINLLGLRSSWKINFENKLTEWFFVNKRVHPKIEKLEDSKSKVIALVKKLKKNVADNFLENCSVFRHTINNNVLHRELDDFAIVSFYDEMFYKDELIKYCMLDNNIIAKKNKNIVINAINSYMKMHGLIVYKESLLEKVENTVSTWRYFGNKKKLNMKEIIWFYKKNFSFYFEYINIDELLLNNYCDFCDIIENAEYHLNNIEITSGIEYYNGYYLENGEFLDKNLIIDKKFNFNFVFNMQEEFTGINQETGIFLQKAKAVLLEIEEKNGIIDR